MSNITFQRTFRVPLAILLVRVYFAAIAIALGLFLQASRSGSAKGLAIIGGAVGVAAIAVLVSFIRVRMSFIYILVALVAIPTFAVFAMDALVLHGAWWEWLIVFPVQVGLPCSWSYYLWKAAPVRQYYLQSREKP